MTISPNRQAKAIYSGNDLGPTFGGGWDLHISGNCDENYNSYSNLGNTYNLPDGYTNDTAQIRSLLAGSVTFKCDEYEVFYQE